MPTAVIGAGLFLLIAHINNVPKPFAEVALRLAMAKMRTETPKDHAELVVGVVFALQPANHDEAAAVLDFLAHLGEVVGDAVKREVVLADCLERDTAGAEVGYARLHLGDGGLRKLLDPVALTFEFTSHPDAAAGPGLESLVHLGAPSCSVRMGPGSMATASAIHTARKKCPYM